MANLTSISGQNLVVGPVSNPNEVLNLNSGSFAYDTVFVLNNGTLNISNQTHFVVKNIIALLGTSKLYVKNSTFEVNTIFYSADNSTANLSDSINLSCDFYLTDFSTIHIDSSQVQINMTYKSQYGWNGSSNSSFEISNSILNLGSGALKGGFSDNSSFLQYNNQYISSTLPMTLSLFGSSIVTIDSCIGGMEFIISENTDVNINASEFFMIWYLFSDGDTADYDYPIPNSSLFPQASHVTSSYSFSNALPNVSGINFIFNVQNTDGLYWGIISRQNSDVTVNNSTILALGFYFDKHSSDSANGFVNDQFYSSYNSPYSDRKFSVNNTKVRVWNFYAVDTAEIVIDNSVFGESLGFGEGIVKVYNSTCDGTGGYFGGHGNSKTYVYSSNIIRTFSNVQILNFQQNSKAWMYNSTIDGNMVISDNAQLLFGNTEYSSVPIINNNAYFAEAWIDTSINYTNDSIIVITGNVWGINGPSNNSNITRYSIEYSSIDTTDFNLIIDTSDFSFNLINKELATWKTNGIKAGDYLLWLTIFVDGDTAISCNRNIFLSSKTGLHETTNSTRTRLYPNPTHGKVKVEGNDIIAINVFDVYGNVLSQNRTDSEIDIGMYSKGVYFLSIKTKSGIEVIKLIKK